MTYRSPLAGLYPEGTRLEQIDDAEVPWVFTSMEEEHTILRTAAGLIDYGCMGRIAVRGTGAQDFLQGELARDIGYLFPEKCLTTLLLDDDGTPLDVVLVYKVQGGYTLQCAAGRVGSTAAHLRAHAPEDVQVEDLSEGIAQIGIEGPFAWQVMTQWFNPQLTGLSFLGVMDSEWEEVPIQVTRLGQTSEYGYQITLAPEAAESLWARLAADVPLVGWAALEVAMLEVRQPLLHRELAGGGTVLSCGLNWLVDIDNTSARGVEAVQAERDAGGGPLTIGFTAEVGADLPAGGAVRAGGELAIGTVVYAVHSPALQQVLGLARVEHDWAASGMELEAIDAGGSPQPIMTRSSPYVTPLSWKIPIV